MLMVQREHWPCQIDASQRSSIVDYSSATAGVAVAIIVSRASHRHKPGTVCANFRKPVASSLAGHYHGVGFFDFPHDSASRYSASRESRFLIFLEGSIG